MVNVRDLIEVLKRHQCSGGHKQVCLTELLERCTTVLVDLLRAFPAQPSHDADLLWL